MDHSRWPFVWRFLARSRRTRAIQVVVVFAVFAFFAGWLTPTPAERLPLLSVEETVGLVFRSDAPWCVMRRANPETRETVFKILGDPDLRRFHPKAVAMLGFVCSSSDLARLEAEVGRRASLSPVQAHHYERSLIFFFMGALINMDRRGVDGAADVLRRMTTVPYWDDMKRKYAPAELATDPPGAHVFDHTAIMRYFETGRSDASEVLEARLEELPEDRRVYSRRELDRHLKDAPTRLLVQRLTLVFPAIKNCYSWTHARWARQLKAAWNNDFGNPQPTRSARAS